MDTVEPTQTEPQVPQGPQQEKTALVVSVVIAAAVLLIIGIVIVYILSNANINTQNNQANNNNTPNTSYTVNKMTASETKEFSGTYIQATVPSDWNIVEYSDVTGMKYYAEQEGLTFSGLTGLSVLDQNGTTVFSLKGVDGIGGAGGCTEVAQFADTQDSFIQTVITETDELGFGPTTVLDYTATDYSEISFLGKDFRRVSNELYIDTANANTVFNAGCGMGGQFVTLSALGFTLSSTLDTYTAYAYEFKINGSIVDELTLIKLDDVLNSIQ